MFKQFMTDLISTDSFKKVLSEQAMADFAKRPGVFLVHSPILYRLYTLYTEGTEDIEERPVFYRKAGAYLYYERFTCNHGEEFYYYVRFNTESLFYQEHRHLIEILILGSDPSTITDYIGTRDLTVYNKTLKENS
jgi:hypothetical protein